MEGDESDAILENLAGCTAFEWDSANAGKIWRKHGVTPNECEQVFFHLPLVLAHDTGHSRAERRFYGLGVTDVGRLLFVVFTQRQDRIRVISARDMSRKDKEGLRVMVKKRVPKLKSEQAERKFWTGKDSSEYLDWRRARRVVFPELRPSVKTISLRVPESMLEELKLLAHRRDVPYQSLMKVFLAERIEQELDRRRRGQKVAALGKPARG